MKMFVFLSILLLSYSQIGFCGTIRHPAPAVEWWLKEQGKFDGADYRIYKKSSENEYNILRWNVRGVSKPSDSELETIIDNYEAYLAQEKTNRRGRKQAILAKLGLNQNDLQALIELIKDGDTN